MKLYSSVIVMLIISFCVYISIWPCCACYCLNITSYCVISFISIGHIHFKLLMAKFIIWVLAQYFWKIYLRFYPFVVSRFQFLFNWYLKHTLLPYPTALLILKISFPETKMEILFCQMPHPAQASLQCISFAVH